MGSAYRGLHPGRSASGGGVFIQGALSRPPIYMGDTTGYSERAGGRYPTGMHSCIEINYRLH